jgi:hypothetical protein
MRIRWSRYLSLPFAGALALAAIGCGDDDGGGNRPDARPMFDAAADIDADTGTTLLRSGTIAVTEASISNNLGISFSGALVRASFSDATTGNAPAPVAGFDSVINNCVIQIWDVGTHTPSTSVDEGPIQVTGTENGPFACGFASADLGYVCQSTDATIAGGSAMDMVVEGTGVDTLVVPDGIADATMKGMYIRLSGFGDGATALPEATFPIVDVTLGAGADTLTLFGVPDAYAGTGDADSTYATFVGVGPVPTGAEFLLGAADAINVAKPAGDVVDAIDEDFHAHGQNFALVDDAGMNKYLPSTVPVTPAADAVEVNFECTECGAVGDGGTIAAIVINGETTDGDTGGVLDPSDPMPDPVTQYATFTCAFVAEDTATLSVDMMKAILGTNPTRIQTSVGRYRGSILMDTESGEWSVNVLQGHAVLGWSDKPPAK